MNLNVRGLKNPVKRRCIFCILNDQKCDTYFRQETYSEISDEIIWRSKWMILINPSLDSAFDSLQKYQNRSIVLVDLSLNDNKFSLSNIYVPNDHRQDLSVYLMSDTDTERLIVGGDWNITLQSIDKRSSTSEKSILTETNFLR